MPNNRDRRRFARTVRCGGVASDQVASGDLLDHGTDYVRTERGGIDFTDAGDAIRCGKLQKDPVLAAVGRWGIGDGPSGYIRDTHDSEQDYVADRCSLAALVEGIVDPVERVSAADELLQLQPARFVKRDQRRNIDDRVTASHL